MHLHVMKENVRMPPSWRSGTWLAPSSVEHTCIRPTGVGDGEGAEQWAYMPQEKYFWVNYHVKFGHFRA